MHRWWELGPDGTKVIANVQRLTGVFQRNILHPFRNFSVGLVTVPAKVLGDGGPRPGSQTSRPESR